MKQADKRAAQGHSLAVQYGALPFRWDAGLEILLITSRETRRWVIPKGWPMKGRKPHGAAAREALEEAGVTGAIEKAAIGSYWYAKALANGATIWVEVEVFPLPVEVERPTWPEMAERVRRWFPAEQAARLVREPELAELIRSFAQSAPAPS